LPESIQIQPDFLCVGRELGFRVAGPGPLLLSQKKDSVHFPEMILFACGFRSGRRAHRIVVNGGTITGLGNDGVHVVEVSYSDTNGDMSLSGGDASLVSRVSTGLDQCRAGVVIGAEEDRLAQDLAIHDDKGQFQQRHQRRHGPDARS
jgi:hypothetical protein